MIDYLVETSRFDTEQYVPVEPRTYLDPGEPAEQCAYFEFEDLGYDDDDPDATWYLTEVGGRWWEPLLRDTQETLCPEFSCFG